MAPLISKWHRELELFSAVKPLIILEGNVLDRYRYPVAGSLPEDTLAPLPEYLQGFLTDSGYAQVVFYSNLVGFMNPYQPQMLTDFARQNGCTVKAGAIPAEFKGNTQETAPNVIRRAMAQGTAATAVIMELASHYIITPERMDQHDVNSFNLLMQSAMSAATVRTPAGRRQNLLILLVNKLNDLPAWFYLNNPLCKTITLEAPDREERKRLISGSAWPTFFDSTVYRTDMPYYEQHPEELSRLREKFVGLTEGLTFTELDAMRRLSKQECTPIRDLCSIVDLYKYGIKENPWANLSLDSLRTAKQDFQKRIKGQDPALERTLDVVKRAVTGMNGLSSSSTSKPKGVLFYAGPTGTGKTETAKALAEKLFGDESACIRFDMSEYGQSHSDQKLLGAPPGYVGYEAGGQLTNAIQKNPFSVVLFDEIEKAHSSILDKFLQILEDGRLTDGQGHTVYFSETIIIFTSNLGMYVKDEFGKRYQNVTMDMDYAEVEKRLRQAVEDHFKLELGRPEILNRIGENIVIFDFIREEAGQAILRSQVDKIIRRMDEQKRIRITVTDEAYGQLSAAALADLSNGGRGIGNQVEALLINPMSRWLFDNGVTEDADVVIEGFDVTARPPCLRCRVAGEEEKEETAHE
ncbi:MAG: ATP-dependent Clp protease ATP-binding subunit [Clostridiales bacterium]|nr:ATP-dependent Clp protease ATP-binding subunit [Clostridiales bacterium]